MTAMINAFAKEATVGNFGSGASPALSSLPAPDELYLRLLLDSDCGHRTPMIYGQPPCSRTFEPCLKQQFQLVLSETVWAPPRPR